ncbi:MULTISPECIES: DUF1631 family protein [unclassified Variovorax]|uniref:DUF1631 family protein n=1 Tax=unclassified Variovorax TaxID=663243 RepID=UPI00257714E8|nr:MULTISPECIES: DUF1631 family protein [unclassified Variovorax]MDM0091076.1 DUF1631 family protein [Variovorax sp. J22G40]MDM0148922.1 DUF1631 family protein [Variovorax sp. J2P1-31]
MSTARPQALSQQLARETRQRFIAATQALIEPLAQAIRDRLSASAAQMGNARDMQDWRDDFLAFQSLGGRWVAQTQEAWRKAQEVTAVGTDAHSLSNLELMGDDVVETQILSSRLGQAVQGKSNFEINDLRLRIQHLEGTEELGAKDVLKPEALARIMVEQWLAAGLTRVLWTRVQDVIERGVLEATAKAYTDANRHLVQQGVMPEIDLKSFVRRTASGHSGVMPLGGGHAPSGAGRPMAAESMGFQAGAGAMGAMHSMGMAGDTLAGTGGSPLSMARQRAQGVLLNLKRFVTARIGGDMAPRGAGGTGEGGLLRGGAGPGAGLPGGFAAAISDAGAAYQLASSQYVVGDEVAALQHSAAELRRRATDLKRRAPTTADKATVEIVALMFQAILAEERIPFSARVWFARLQMPVLRVAIAEPEFFGTLQHPARMLIDRMGSVVMGFDAAAISGSALEGEIRRVVQVIEQYPETGQRVFKLVFDEFVAFLNKYLTQSDSTQRVMSVAQQVEQKETMAIQYTIELRKMLNDMPVREEIREFLFKIWAEVLAIAALKYGAQDEQTVTLKRAASELVWAASAKPNRNDRTRVIQDLPKLLQRLRSGMALLGIVGEPQEAQIKTIGVTLSDAFLSKTEAIPQAKIEAMASRLANLEDFVSDEGTAELPLDAASIELLLGVDAASIEVVPDTRGAKIDEDMLQWARELQVGNWFMLDHNNRASQVQFVWRSERKQLHLFASADGRSFLIQAGRLASYLQAGLLVPAEEETLTVRATREALAKLDANPERLLN